MRPVEARYDDGFLKPAKPLQLRPGENVSVIVVRRADPARWNLERLGNAAVEDAALAAVGLDGFADALDAEGRR